MADDVVDVVYDAFDHDGGVGGAGLLEEFGEGGFAAVFVFGGWDFFFGVDQVAGEVEQGFEEGDAVQLPRFVLFFESFEAFGEFAVERIAHVLAQTVNDFDLQFFGFAVGVICFEHGFEQFGVEDDFVEVVADSGDMHVLVDEFDGLCAERVPEQCARAAGRLDRDVDLREPAVVAFVFGEKRVGGDRFPQAGEITVIGGEGIAHVVIGQTFLGGDESFVAVEGAVYAREVGEAFLHGCGEFGLEVDDIRDDAAEACFVEFERLGNVVEDAEVIHDETVGLFIAVGAVGARDGLQQGVVAHGLVEIHGLQDGRVETCQQFGGDDDDLQRVVRVAVTVEQFFFGVAVAFVESVAFVFAFLA